ncbi:MAG TPA: TonB-dependent receptor, partial [bacterium]|nr:TonB-dependent receptor [bacterium]
VVGTTLGAVSAADGTFTIERVPEGMIALQVSMIGYKPVIQPDLMVTPIKPLEVNIGLNQTVLAGASVTIKPSYFESVSDKPLSVQTQSYAEIRRLPGGYEDVVRAISILPGVAQAQNGRNDLIVRGGAPSENLYVIDGVEVPNINHYGTQGATGGPLSFVNLDYVENTTFSTGGFGVRYGDRLSSVTNIEMRKGREDRWGGKGTISASQFGLNLEGPISEKGSLVFSARRSYLDFIFKAAGFAFVPEYWDFLVKGDYKLGPHDQLSLTALSAIDNVKLFNDTAEKRYDNSRVVKTDQYEAVAGLTWRHLFTSGYTTLSLSNNRFRYDLLQSDTTQKSIFKNNSLERETLLTANLVLKPARRTEVTLGGQARAVLFESAIAVPPFTSPFGQLFSIDATLDTTAVKGSTWLQLVQKSGPFSLTVGGRYDYFNLINQGSAFSPRASLEYAWGPLTRLSLSAGRYHQAPAYIWLVANPLNRRLRQIRADQFILGVQHLLRDDLKLNLEGYYKKYSRYPASTLQPWLVMANTGAGYGGAEEGFASYGIDPLISEGTGWARGIELFAQKRLSQAPWYGLLSVSYNEAQFKGLDGIGRPGSFDQRWIANLGGGWIPNSRWEFSTRFRLATGRPYTPYNADYSRSGGLYNTVRIGVNHSLDLRVDRHWQTGGMGLITFIDIQNIYNRKFKDVPRWNAFKKELDETSSIGILPTIGISAEF